MRVTINDYMTTDILVEAYKAQKDLKLVLLDVLDKSIELKAPNVEEGIYTIPYPDLINTIERNLDALTAGGIMPSNMLPTVNWKGELNDARRLSYIDVNRWFDSVEKITALSYGIAYRTPVTGTFSTGNNRTVQLIRSVS